MSDLIERPTDAADPTYPDAERCAQTLEACEDDLLTEAQFVRWQGQEIERLAAERSALRRQLSEWLRENSPGGWIDELRRQLAEAKQDARRYRDWLRGGANIPPESTRWARWEVRHWDGRYWNTLFAEALDTSIDAAMGGGDAG